MKNINTLYKRLIKELRSNLVIYVLLSVVLIGGLFTRVYRTGQILGFYFDQGRDALVIWDFWHNGKFFLVGPTTGIAGIFRGPFYYYLIAPLYLIGRGDPVWPAVFLAFTSVMAIGLIYYLGKKVQDRQTGLIAATIASFSFFMMLAGRWLSNPTPMLLLSMLLVWMMFLVYEGKRWAWAAISLILGVSLFHFGSAGEVFYFPAVLVFGIWMLGRNKWSFKETIGWKVLFISIGFFGFTALPQIGFDIRHNGILRQNIKGFLLEEGSFKSNFTEVARIRLRFYYDVFFSKIFFWIRKRELALISVIVGYFIIFLPKLIKNDYVKILLLLFVAPLIGLLFFQGNFGNIFDYYLTGYYQIFILLFALVMGIMWKSMPGKFFVFYFFLVFLTWNREVTWNKINDGVDGPLSVAFKNEKQAVDWIYEDANGRDFNVDVYVPPVIPHTYDYLFTWYGPANYDKKPVEERIELLYTIYEEDPPHPERLQAWLDRQAGIAEEKESTSFGGITAQRRARIKNE